MSDVASPSFFPTPHEIAGGIRWVREHPVVATAAAAAATAVSVITFLRAARTLVDDENDDCTATADDDAVRSAAPPRLDAACARDLDDLPPPRERFSTWNDHYPRVLHTHDDETPVRSLSHQDFTPHKLQKEAEDVYSNTDSEMSAASRSLLRRNSPPSSSKLCDDTDSDDSPRGVNIPPTCLEGVCFDPEDDDNSTSPQWGWYVSTTPPDEQYS